MGKNYPSTGAGFLPSTVSSPIPPRKLETFNFKHLLLVEFNTAKPPTPGGNPPKLTNSWGNSPPTNRRLGSAASCIQQFQRFIQTARGTWWPHHPATQPAILQRNPENPTKCGRSVRKNILCINVFIKFFWFFFLSARNQNVNLYIFMLLFFCNFPQISFWWVCFWQHGPDALLIQYALGMNPSQWQWQMKVERNPLQHMYQKFQVPKREVLTYISFM